MNANDVQAQFQTEAHDLVAKIEQELLHLLDDPSSQRIHTLMRTAHTLKGAAASVEKEAIQNVAHVLEDIFVALYNPNLCVDQQVEALLFEGLECLRLLLQGRLVDESAVMNRAASVIAQLQEKFGDEFKTDNPIPSSEELGFDIVAAMFEAGVTQRLELLKTSVEKASTAAPLSSVMGELNTMLKTHANVFLGLAESLGLEGFRAIASLTLAALDQHPKQTLAIAKVALADFSNARQIVLAGDRTQGGTPSVRLQQYGAPFAKNGGSSQEDKTPSMATAAFNSHGAERDQVPENLTSSASSISSTFSTMDEDINHLFESFEAPEAPESFEAPEAPESPEVLEDMGGIVDIEAYIDNTDVSEAGDEDIAGTAEKGSAENLNDDVLKNIKDEDIEQLMADLAGWEEQSDSAPQSMVPPTPVPTTIYPQPVLSDSPPAESSQTQQPVATSPDKDRSRASASIRVGLDQLQHLEHLASELLIKQNVHVNDHGQIQGLLQEILLSLRQHNQTINELWDWSEDIFTSASIQSSIQSSIQASVQSPIQPSIQSSIQSSVQSPIQASVRVSDPIIPTTHERNLDALELDRHSHLHVLMQSALEETSRLESLITSVEQIQKRSQRSVKGQKRLLTQTWDTLTHTRMQSLDTLFQRLPRLLRQLNMTHDKQVNLVLPDNEILVDRLLVEAVYDALIHLMRNAFDHGIESPEKRQMLGKSSIGNIWIRAFNQGRHTVIELEDDGSGVDLNRVGQVAIAQGFITAEQLPQCSPAQMMDFLFEAGFSTAEQLSDLSGRGVGLDVVRSQIEQLKGTVNVRSEPGQGTCFTLRLPFNLSVLRQMLCQADGIVYALPVEHIEQVIQPQADQIQQTGGGGFILKGSHNVQRNSKKHSGPIMLYPLQDLLSYAAPSALLKRPLASSSQPLSPDSCPRSPASDSDLSSSPVLLMRHRQTLIGIMVDQILEEQELVIRPLEQTIAAPSYIHGCSIFGDNQLTLVIDPLTLMDRSTQLPLSQLQPKDTPPHLSLPSSSGLAKSNDAPQPKVLGLLGRSDMSSSLRSAVGGGATSEASMIAERSLVLVIDDSPTVRQTLSKMLDENGFQTLEAGDGLEALAMLRQTISLGQSAPAIILCDIEMPQMDGFQFLAEQRKDPSLTSIPVVMVTSRSNDKHRQIALELGATDYLTKPYTHTDLMTTIQSALV
ncbi:MAG: hybrid sensor histidine kinase/response regulator [Cyanobacteria bacterium P01_F01_bin.150]